MDAVRVLLLSWCCCASAGAQQLLSNELVEAYRQAAPKTDDPFLNDMIENGTWYTNSTFSQPSFIFASAQTFPWRTTLGGGSHFGSSSVVKTAKILRTEEPIAVFGNNSEHWCYPKEAAVAEIAWMVDDGLWYAFESRRRLREPDDWETDIIEPFPTREKLMAEVAKTHPDIAARIPEMPIREFRIRSRHPRPSFDGLVKLQILPEFPRELIIRLLTTVVHESSAGVEYADDCDGFYQTSSEFHIRPKADMSAVNGNGEREQCRNCHQDIHHPATDFGILEDWRVRGGDGIFSIRPVSGGSTRADLVRAGLVKHWRNISPEKRQLYHQSIFLIDELQQ